MPLLHLHRRLEPTDPDRGLFFKTYQTQTLAFYAGKRLAPTDPDKSVPRPAPIPWWDDLRWV